MSVQAAPSLPTENAAECRTTAYGCCYDRTTAASGPNGEGCPNPPNHSKRTAEGTTCERHKDDIWVDGCFPTVERSICSLPRAAGSCSTWVSRYHYDIIASKCVHFWFGSCHGNSNNFASLEECQRACQVPEPSSADPAKEASGPVRPASPAGGSTGGRSRNMGRIFTVHRAPGGSASRRATSAATHANRGRSHLGYRRPFPATAAQHSGPAAR